MAIATQAQPVNLYAEDPRLPRTLRAQFEQLVQSRKDFITSGGCKSFEDYKQRIGEIQGFQSAIAICQDAEKDLPGS